MVFKLGNFLEICQIWPSALLSCLEAWAGFCRSGGVFNGVSTWAAAEDCLRAEPERPRLLVKGDTLYPAPDPG